MRPLPTRINRDGSRSSTVFQVDAADVVVEFDGKKKEQLSVMHVWHGTGAQGLPRAVFSGQQIELLESPEEDYKQYTVPNYIITAKVSGSVPAPSKTGFSRFGKTFFWGVISGSNVTLGDSDQFQYEAGIFPHLFGSPVEGMLERHRRGDVLLRAPLLFNPAFSLAGDSAKHRHQGGGTSVMARGNRHPDSERIFLDPLCVVTNEARQANVGRRERNNRDPNTSNLAASDTFWTLADIVYYLCITCNADELYIANPDFKRKNGGEGVSNATTSHMTIDGVDMDGSESLVRDLRIPLGVYLPEALDMVLNPYGYTWTIDLVPKKPTIKIFERGKGDKKILNIPGLRSRGRAGATRQELAPGLATCQGMNIATGIMNRAETVRILGDFKLWESTFELKRAWAADKDTLAETSLTRGTSSFETSTENLRVWRDWVLNEDGSYNDLREGYGVFDFSSVFDTQEAVIPRRRRFYPCIASSEDRLPFGRHGYVVEWSRDGGTTWNPIDSIENSTFEVLQAECGISFVGHVPPAELRFAGDDAKVRITASVYSDERLMLYQSVDAAGKLHEPFGLALDYPVITIDGSDRFFFRKLARGSQYWSKVSRGSKPSSQIDDTEKMKELAARVLRSMAQNDASGSASLGYMAVEDEWSIGDVIEKAETRDLEFEINSYSGESKYPQVTGIHYDFQQQTQTLEFETFRNTRFV